MPGIDEPTPPDPGRAASDPDEAAREAEEALARIEALADVDVDSAGGPDAASTPSGGAAEAAGKDDPAGSAGEAESRGAGSRGEGESGDEAASPGEPEGAAAGGSRPGQCNNCGALLDGPYCSQCGQKAADRVVPLWHLLNEALEAVFELDLRVLHTLPRFLFLPGRLTEEYIEGRRRRYIRPFRLYLLATFLLFTTLALLRPGGVTALFDPNEALQQGAVQQGTADAAPPRSEPVAPETAQRVGLAGLAPALAADSLRPGAAAGTPPGSTAAAGMPPGSPAAAATRPDGAARAASEILGDGNISVAELERMEAADTGANLSDPTVQREFARLIRDSLDVPPLTGDPRTNAQIERILSTKGARAITHPREFLAGVTDRVPYMMFLLLPVFAVLLKLLYLPQGRLYMEHFIFTLHIHALVFFAFTAGVLMNEASAPAVNAAAEWVMASPVLYLIVAMRRIYRQGFLKTTLKAGVLLGAYSIVLTTGLAVLSILTVVLM